MPLGSYAEDLRGFGNLEGLPEAKSFLITNLWRSRKKSRF
jgi:hypothetical protein